MNLDSFYIFPLHILSQSFSSNTNIHVASTARQAVCLRYFIINLFISPDKLLINGNGGLTQLGNLCLNKSPALKVLQNCQAYILTTRPVLLNLFYKNRKLYKYRKNIEKLTIIKVSKILMNRAWHYWDLTCHLSGLAQWLGSWPGPWTCCGPPSGEAGATRWQQPKHTKVGVNF